MTRATAGFISRLPLRVSAIHQHIAAGNIDEASILASEAMAATSRVFLIIYAVPSSIIEYRSNTVQSCGTDSVCRNDPRQSKILGLARGPNPTRRF
jgi:hypothetical protein